MSCWKYSLKQLVYLLPLMNSVHKIHFPPFRSHFKSNLVSISEIRGGPQKPLGHLVQTEEIKLQKNREFPLQKRMMKFLKDETLNFFPLTAEGTLSSATYANPVKEILQMRRKFITQEANSCKEILNVCPYLGTPSQVSKFSVCHYNISKKLCFPGAQRFLSEPKPKKFSPCLVLRCCLLPAKIHPRRR